MHAIVPSNTRRLSRAASPARATPSEETSRQVDTSTEFVVRALRRRDEDVRTEIIDFRHSRSYRAPTTPEAPMRRAAASCSPSSPSPAACRESALAPRGQPHPAPRPVQVAEIRLTPAMRRTPTPAWCGQGGRPMSASAPAGGSRPAGRSRPESCRRTATRPAGPRRPRAVVRAAEADLAAAEALSRQASATMRRARNPCSPRAMSRPPIDDQRRSPQCRGAATRRSPRPGPELELARRRWATRRCGHRTPAW